MFSDDELAALREVERRLRWASPELFRLFNSQEAQPATDRRKPARTRVLIAAAALSGLALLGPRMLNEAEVRTQRRRPLPRTASADSAIAPRADLVSGPAGPVGGVDILLAPSTMVATPSRHGPCAEEGPSLLDRQPERVELLSREALTCQKPVRKGTRDHMATSNARGDGVDRAITMTRADSGNAILGSFDCTGS